MTTVASLIVDCSLHASSVPATYVAPGPLQNIGVSATQGSTTGTLSATAPQVPSSLTVTNTNTYTVVSGNVRLLGSNGGDGICGYVTAANAADDIIIFPIGFTPTRIEIFNEGAGTKYDWFFGQTAGKMVLTTLSAPTLVDTATQIKLDLDSAGGDGNACIVSFVASVMAGGDLFCYRFYA